MTQPVCTSTTIAIYYSYPSDEELRIFTKHKEACEFIHKVATSWVDFDPDEKHDYISQEDWDMLKACDDYLLNNKKPRIDEYAELFCPHDMEFQMLYRLREVFEWKTNQWRAF